MIKFATTNSDGSHLLGLGLSAENVKRLQAGEPILFNLSEIGLRLERTPMKNSAAGGRVLMMFGETEEVIKEEVYSILGRPRVEIYRKGKG